MKLRREMKAKCYRTELIATFFQVLSVSEPGSSSQWCFSAHHLTVVLSV